MYHQKPQGNFFDNMRMEDTFIRMTQSPEMYKKGFEFNYTKILNVYTAKKKKNICISSSNSYHRRLIYTNNFSKSKGKTNNRIKMWVNNTNSWFKGKYSCYTYEMVLKTFL